MPSGEVTLQRIQREIYEVKMREEELRKKYAKQTSENGDVTVDDGDETTNNLTNGHSSPVTPTPTPPPVVLTNGTGKVQTNGAPKFADIALNLTNTKVTRRFAPNSTTKGVMQRFIKSKGKLALTSLAGPQSGMSSGWNSTPILIEDTISPPKVEPGKTLRRSYVPVEERMKKEFQEMHHREHELKLERTKSQSDLLNVDEEEEEGDGRRQVVSPSKMRTARSVSHLSDSDAYQVVPDDTQSEPCSLKPARSLAQLCAEDVDEEEVDAPGSLTLIRQWESLIQKNQQLRT